MGRRHGPVAGRGPRIRSSRRIRVRGRDPQIPTRLASHGHPRPVDSRKGVPRSLVARRSSNRRIAPNPRASIRGCRARIRRAPRTGGMPRIENVKPVMIKQKINIERPIQGFGFGVIRNRAYGKQGGLFASHNAVDDDAESRIFRDRISRRIELDSDLGRGESLGVHGPATRERRHLYAFRLEAMQAGCQRRVHGRNLVAVPGRQTQGQGRSHRHHR